MDSIAWVLAQTTGETILWKYQMTAVYQGACFTHSWVIHNYCPHADAFFPDSAGLWYIFLEDLEVLGPTCCSHFSQISLNLQVFVKFAEQEQISSKDAMGVLEQMHPEYHSRSLTTHSLFMSTKLLHLWSSLAPLVERWVGSRSRTGFICCKGCKQGCENYCRHFHRQVAPHAPKDIKKGLYSSSRRQCRCVPVSRAHRSSIHKIILS